jgi:hypothetical protein
LTDVDPGQAIVAHSGYSVACLDVDGWIAAGRQGLYDFDTRILSRYRLTISGRTPQLVSLDQPESDRIAPSPPFLPPERRSYSGYKP